MHLVIFHSLISFFKRRIILFSVIQMNATQHDSLDDEDDDDDNNLASSMVFTNISYSI